MSEIKFVGADGNILFKESENGELSFVDKSLQTQFQEAQARVNSGSATGPEPVNQEHLKERLTKVEDTLRSLYTSPTEAWPKERIETEYARLESAMKAISLSPKGLQ